MLIDNKLSMNCEGCNQPIDWVVVWCNQNKKAIQIVIKKYNNNNNNIINNNKNIIIKLKRKCDKSEILFIDI